MEKTTCYCKRGGGDVHLSLGKTGALNFTFGAHYSVYKYVKLAIYENIIYLQFLLESDTDSYALNKSKKKDHLHLAVRLLPKEKSSIEENFPEGTYHLKHLDLATYAIGGRGAKL